MEKLKTDLLVGIDVGGDSLAEGHEPGLRSPLADSIMLAAWAELERRGRRTIWGVFGYGSDGELTVDEIEGALTRVAAAGGLLGCWSLTPKIVAELEASREDGADRSERDSLAMFPRRKRERERFAAAAGVSN